MSQSSISDDGSRGQQSPRSTRSRSSAKQADADEEAQAAQRPTRSRGTTPASSVAGDMAVSTPRASQEASARNRDSEAAESSPQRSVRSRRGAGAANDSLVDILAPSDIGSTSSPLSYTTGTGLRTPLSMRSSITSGRTPGGYRADLDSSVKHHRRVELNDIPEEAAMEVDQTPRGPRIVIWGTNICVADVQKQFKAFLSTFRIVTPAEDEIALRGQGAVEGEIDVTKPYYLQRFDEIALIEEPHLNLNLEHVRTFDEKLYAQVVSYPSEIIPYLDMAATELFRETCSEAAAASPDLVIQIRPFNAQKTRNMRGLNPEDIDQLITVCGMVVRSSSLIPEMKVGFFECTVCRKSLTVEVERARIEEPTLCQNCNTNHSFGLIHNRSFFMDKQLVKLQESPDDMPDGQTPHSVSLYAHGDLVDAIQPGDRVTVTGIFRAMPLRVNPRMSTIKAVYKTYVDVLHYRKTDVSKLHSDHDGTHFTAERIAQFEELSRKPDIYERLAHALAPSIYEHDDIKKGILCLLFGGTRKDFSNSGRGKFRAEINMLLCGDPGTSKSQLLQYVHQVVPRSQYTSGKGSSAVGLTAYVTKDPETGQLVLQTGALVLSDNGVCCIDEFDKMSDSTRSVLHEVMEQQTLSIAKAGIICQLNARASVLAAANPVDSQWNRNKTIIENVQLPHTLLSRFDLIFLMVDPQDEVYDRRLATHLVSLYYRTPEEEAEEYLDMSLIRDYIAFAKATIHPKLNEEASQSLIEKYVTMRKIGSGRGQVSAFPRQLESLIRLSEAHAKIRLSNLVELKDVEEANRLHREALKQSAIDPLTGKVDVNILALGLSASSRKQIQELMDVIKQHLAKKAVSIAYRALLQELRDGSDRMVNRDLFEEALNELRKQDVISRDSNNRIKLMPRMAADASD